MVKVGDVLYMTPTIDCKAFMRETIGPQRCWVVNVNEKHRHFTVEFNFSGNPLRETYKMEEAQ